MCRNIKILFNFDPPATDEEIKNASMQYVRKLSGFNKPSKINEEAFNQAILDISSATKNLLGSLETHTHPKDREIEAAKKRARFATRFGTSR